MNVAVLLVGIVVCGMLAVPVSGDRALSWTVPWANITGATPTVPSIELQSSAIGLCICDVHPGLCDPNCCCDKDCTVAQREGGFTGCLRQVIGNKTVLYCHKKPPLVAQRVFDNNQEVQERTYAGEDAVCVYRDNTPTGMYEYFPQPAPLRGADITTPKPREWYSPASEGGALGYKVGDRVPLVAVVPNRASSGYQVTTRNHGFIGLPSEGARGICADDRMASFMKPFEDGVCFRSGTLRQLCSASLSLDRHTMLGIPPPQYTTLNPTTVVPIVARIVNATTLERIDEADPSAILQALALEPDQDAPDAQPTATVTLPNVGAQRKLLQVVSPAPGTDPTATPTHAVPKTVSKTVDATVTETLDPPPTFAPLPPRQSKATDFVEDAANGVAICRNAVVGVRTVVRYQFDASLRAPGTIVGAVSDVLVADVSVPLARVGERVRVKQDHSVLFESAQKSDDTLDMPKKNPGNPGYRQGVPLNVGTLVTQQSKTAVLQRVGGFSLPAGPACSAASFTRVGFLHNVVSSGCHIDLTEAELMQVCAQPTSTTDFLAAALQPSDVHDVKAAAQFNATLLTLDRVGRTAAAKIENPADWVPIIDAHAPHPQPSPFNRVKKSCSSVHVGFHWTFVVGRAGADYNPQDVIVGAKVEPITATWRFRNDADTSAGAKARFHLQFRASFIRYRGGDQDTKARVVKAPPLLPEIDEDVFYPFTLPTGPNEEVVVQDEY